MASASEGSTRGLALAAAGAKVGQGSHFWIEEASAGPRGNLYVIAEGIAREATEAARGLRDQFYGESTASETSLALREALLAANDYLLRQGGIGVAVLSATTSGGSQMTLARLGDAQAYLYCPHRGSVETLFPATAPSPSLGTQPHPEVQQISRRLSDGDRLLLCSAALTEALDEAELSAALAAGLGGEEVVRHLVEMAQVRAPGDMVALLISAQDVPAQISLEGLWLDEGPALVEVAAPQQTPPPQSVLPLASRLRLPRWALALAGGLGLALLVFLGWGRLSPSPVSPTPTARPAGAALPLEEPTPAPGITPNPTAATTLALRRRVDQLWPEGDKGSVAALQEIVALLEQLQAQTMDPNVEEKLGVARANLAYRQKMEEVAGLWRDETSAATATSWIRAVEILEALYSQTLPSAYQNTVQAKLYSAHINYGRALVAADRTDEARGQFQRAIKIDPDRPEAVDALRRLP